MFLGEVVSSKGLGYKMFTGLRRLLSLAWKYEMGALKK